MAEPGKVSNASGLQSKSTSNLSTTMITAFPDPYPDELLYSVCARYRDLMRYTDNRLPVLDFFNRKQQYVPMDLPNALDHLVESLPPGHLYTSDKLRDDHTLFPLYAPFLHPERAQLVKKSLRSHQHNRAHVLIGTVICKHLLPSALRFCPLCVAEDRKRFGSTYWHRIHQLNCIDLCLHHGVFLEASSAKVDPRLRVFSAEEAVHETAARPMADCRFKSLQLKIAEFAAWLLSSSVEPLGGRALQDRYFNLLLERDFAFHTGRIRSTLLAEKLVEFYSSEWLTSHGHGLNASLKRSWLMSLLLSYRVERVQPPIRHILFLVFLGCTANEVFKEFKAYEPFGSGPWPCLNRIADHYKEDKVTSCAIVSSASGSRLPFGIFKCQCGYTYGRHGPDTTGDDRFRGYVQSYGSVWEKALRTFWVDSSLSIPKIARRLGVECVTVVAQGIKIGLSYPRDGNASSTAYSQVAATARRMKKIKEAESQKRRELFLALIEANPTARRCDLRRTHTPLLRMLTKHDPEWLEDHLPPLRSEPQRVSVNWKRLDIELARLIRTVATEILLKDPPIRVSLKEIHNKIGRRYEVRRLRKSQTRTAKVLEKYLESFEGFCIRRITWVEKCYLREAIVPLPSAFKLRAGVPSGARLSVAVHRASCDAIRRLGAARAGV